jgi:formamidopyrimidine-DNA glycosylase
VPELPEVETTRRGIAPLVTGRRVARVVVREARLRWRVPPRLARELAGQTIDSVTRRAKYLLLGTRAGTVIVHLGMSGSLRVVAAAAAPRTHDHVDIVFDDGRCLRLHDPRRFGSILWSADPANHPLLAGIGPEPLGAAFTGEYLFGVSRARRRAIRDVLLDGNVVAGIGNIYANEALFAAGIRPRRAAGKLTRAECARLVGALRTTLTRALRAGGTTLRDYLDANGAPGEFSLKLKVYGRPGRPCPRCRAPIRQIRLGQRSAFFCPTCQL